MNTFLHHSSACSVDCGVKWQICFFDWDSVSFLLPDILQGKLKAGISNKDEELKSYEYSMYRMDNKIWMKAVYAWIDFIVLNDL